MGKCNRSAHRWRDRAAVHYEVGRYELATRAKHKNDTCYALKERGIVEGRRPGILRYAGASPQATEAEESERLCGIVITAWTNAEKHKKPGHVMAHTGRGEGTPKLGCDKCCQT